MIDDHEPSREALATLLDVLGCLKTRDAANVPEALAVLRNGNVRPCMILLDLYMPEQDGREFLRLQRADAALADIPVIAVSGSHRVGDTAAKLGIASTVLKPIDPDQLLALIAQHCSGRSASIEH